MTTDVFGVPVEAVAIGGGALAAIVAGATLLRRRRQQPRIDTEAAAIDGAATLPGFAPRAAVLGHDGAAALVGGAGERLALVRAHGSRLVAREIGWDAVRATPGGIVVETGERRSGKDGGGVPIVGIDALDVRRLAPAASLEAIRIAERLAPPA